MKSYVLVDGLRRPTRNSLGNPIAYTQDGLIEFWRWFDDSRAVDKSGRPLVLYHGTGSLENLESFDPDFAGRGTDQIGSGFYFTTSPEEASSYAALGPGKEKIGGMDSPGVSIVYLNIRSPITVKDQTLNKCDLHLTAQQAGKIIRLAPGLYDIDESPLGNWYDIWSDGITERKIDEVARNYSGHSLISLENDFFRGHSEAFRHAVFKACGRDGVRWSHDDERAHWVAWFPEQIRTAFCVDHWSEVHAEHEAVSTRRRVSDAMHA